MARFKASGPTPPKNVPSGPFAPVKGRRIEAQPEPAPIHTGLKPGDYFLISPQYMVAVSPDGEHGAVYSPPWTITEHPDRTITVRASIWFNKPHGWHGFLTKGVWERRHDEKLRAKLKEEPK